jgi:hypothetical protein
MSDYIQNLESIIEHEMANEGAFGINLRIKREFNKASYDRLKNAITEYVKLIKGSSIVSRKIVAYTVVLEQMLLTEVDRNNMSEYPRNVREIQIAHEEISKLLDIMLWDLPVKS